MTYRRALLLSSLVLVPLLLVVASPDRPADAQFNTAHDCVGCHSLHGGTGPALTRAATYELLCMSCHNPAAPVGLAPPADYHTEDPNDSNDGTTYSFQVDCVECHLDPPHSNAVNAWGGVNLKLVRGSVTNPSNGVSYDIRFEALEGDHSLCDAEGPGGRQDPQWGENLCDMCHSGIWAGRHQNDPVAGGSWGDSNHHQNGAQCTQSGCHQHDRGFQLR